MKKYKREKLIVSIFAVIFVVIVVILGNFLVTYISSDLSLARIVFCEYHFMEH